MRLNLGAGKMTFPWDAEREVTRHPLALIPDTAYESDWVNVDHFAMDGIQKVVDLFAYPWDWECNSIDEIWCAHIVEHIPHEGRASDIAMRFSYEQGRRHERWQELKQLDSFFAFFAECYRILKPNGKITIVAPYGKCDGALQDPTHTRSIVESTFHYLNGAGIESPTYNYHLPFRFECTNLGYLLYAPYDQMEDEQVKTAIRQLWNVAHTIKCELIACK